MNIDVLFGSDILPSLVILLVILFFVVRVYVDRKMRKQVDEGFKLQVEILLADLRRKDAMIESYLKENKGKNIIEHELADGTVYHTYEDDKDNDVYQKGEANE